MMIKNAIRCGIYPVDGGSNYLRCCFKEPGCYTDVLSVVESEEKKP